MNYPKEAIDRLEKSLTFSTEGYVQVKRNDILTLFKWMKYVSEEHNRQYDQLLQEIPA